MKVSVIIPVYNTEKYIGRCLDSILRQTHQDFEVLCVNDCSPDHAMDVVSRYARRDPRIKMLGHDRNRGPMVARQTGIQKSSGDFYMFVDSDDTLPVDAMESLITAARKDASEVVVAGHNVVDKDGNKTKEDFPLLQDGVYTPLDIFHALVERNIRHNLAFCIFAKSLFNGEFYTLENQANCEDMILFYELVGASKRVSVIRKTVYNYYQNPGSTTHSAISRDVLNQMVYVFNFQYDFLVKNGLPESKVLGFVLPDLNILYLYGGKDLLQKLNPGIREALDKHAIRNYLPFKKRISHLMCESMPRLVLLLLKAKALLRNSLFR